LGRLFHLLMVSRRKTMKRPAASFGLAGLALVFLLTSITPAEGCWRGRHGRRCAVSCPPCTYGQTVGPFCGLQPVLTPAVGVLAPYAWLYCDGSHWQDADDTGHTAVWKPASLIGKPCPGYITGTDLYGCGLYFNLVDRHYHWYSDDKSSNCLVSNHEW